MLHWKWNMRQGAAALVLLAVIANSCSLPRVDLEERKKPQEPLQVTLVLGTRHGDYWKTVYMGAEAASRETGVSLHFLAADDENDVQVQEKLIVQAVADGADALVLAPVSEYPPAETFLSAKLRIPVVTIDSPAQALKAAVHIGTDHYASGVQAADELIRLLGGKSARVGIMGFLQGIPKADLREKGLLDKLKGHPEIEVAGTYYCYSDQRLAEDLTYRMLQEQGGLDAIVALNAAASQGVGTVLRQMGLSHSIAVVGFDSSTQELEMLQNGTIRSSVVQNPFGMGYLGVWYAVASLKGGKVPKTVDTGSKAVRTEDMFSPENQKLLFPLLK